MIFFFDTCAIVRNYCNDVGSQIIKKIVSSNSKIVISYFSITETISALKKCIKDQTLINFDEKEYEKAKKIFLQEVHKNFVVIQVTKKVLDEGINIADKYGTGGADSVILATAVEFSKIIEHTGEKVLFVTSDQVLVDAAKGEASKMKNFDAFHFWSCKCKYCNSIFIPHKAQKNIVCPNCKNRICNQCSYDNCSNDIDLITL